MSGSGVIRKRDVGILFIVLLAMYLSLKGQESGLSYSLEPAWYVDQRKTSLPSASGWPMVPPVITDLEGDGNKEVVYITKDLQLKVISADAPNNDHSEIYTPEELAAVRLSSLNVQKGRIPVALKTGYVQPYSQTKERSQVIIVVREDWTVTCFDSNLNVLWEKAVAHKTHELDTLIDKFSIDEVSVFLAPLSIAEGSTGMVIVGASMSLRDDTEVDIEFGLDMNEDANKEHPDMHARAMLEHFSVYALDASTGHVLWRHDGLDVRPEQFIRSLPQHAYELDVADLSTKAHHAPGINDWTIFRQSLIAELPHDWHGRDDTSLRMAHFERRHMGARSNNPNAPKSKAGSGGKIFGGGGSGARKGGGGSGNGGDGSRKKENSGRQLGPKAGGEGRFTGVETPPLSQNAMLPHDAAEHTEYPNVLVAHTKNGLEVIALRTGIPITSLALTAGNTYADLDGDGVVDAVLVLESQQDVAAHGEAFSHEGGELQHCAVMAISGLPPRSQLFNGTICSRRNSLQDPLSNKHSGGGVSDNTKMPAYVSAASPVVFRAVDPRTLLESKTKDLIIAINTGIVTCYSGTGVFKWQTKGAPTWDTDDDESVAYAMHFDSDSSRVDDMGKHDNIHAQLLVMGDHSMSLISREGIILAVAEIPKRPIARPVIGDFDSDGVTDVIVYTEDAILGYRLEVIASTRGLLLALIALSTFAAVVFVANIRVEDNDAGSGRPRKNVLSLARSTEEYHLD